MLLFVGLVIETCGSTGVSTMIGTAAEAPVFPAASLAVAERECEPGDVVPESHVIVKGTDVAEPIGVVPESRKKSTRVTPKLSEALAVIETFPETCAPELGLVIE